MFIGLLMQFIRLIYANKIEQTAKCTGTHTDCTRTQSEMHSRLELLLAFAQQTEQTADSWVKSNQTKPNRTKSNDIDSSVHCKTPVGREKQRSLCK